MAIFIVLLSVSFVSAVDTTDAVIADDDDDDASVENTTDDDSDDDDDDADDEDDDEDDEDDDDEDDDDEEDLELDDSPYRHGELTSSEAAALADAPDNANGVAGSSNNAKTTGTNTNATGNPLLVLLAAIAALGVYPISRRK